MPELDSKPATPEQHAIELQWPGRGVKKAIWPIFLPFLGCPVRCVFCSQEAQTGGRQLANLVQLKAQLEENEQGLMARLVLGGAVSQLAFYGGTFTAMKSDALDLCLETARRWRDLGLISSFRCSTRPDCISEEIIRQLLASGCQLVELGIQSFSPSALDAAHRGYTPAQAVAAIELLRSAGLGPGIQLMPGMPGSTPRDFLNDVRQAIDLRVACFRFYPCLVLPATGLATLWREGKYTPWTLTQTLDHLAQGYLLAVEAGIPVIRMGLAPQPGLQILAGPWHEALGSRVMGRALALFVARTTDKRHYLLSIPENARGYYLGWRGELNGFWQRQRQIEVQFWSQPLLRLDW